MATGLIELQTRVSSEIPLLFGGHNRYDCVFTDDSNLVDATNFEKEQESALDIRF
jgi:hypothetical protein